MAYADVILADSPVGYWRLGESAGTSAVNAVAANHGTIAGGPTLSQPGAVPGDTAILFDGFNDVITLSSNPYAGAAGFSIEIWFKAPTPDADKIIWDNRFGNSSSTGVNLELTTTLVTARIGAFGSNYTVSAPVAGYINNGWHHAVVVRTPGSPDGTIKLYLDAVLINTVVLAGMGAYDFAGSYPFKLGAVSPTPSKWFPGSLDELATYNVALSPVQVAAHYAAAFAAAAPAGMAGLLLAV